MQEAVLNKILLDGFGVTANLYSNFADTYIHHEKEETKTENTEVDENKSGKNGKGDGHLKFLDRFAHYSGP